MPRSTTVTIADIMELRAGGLSEEEAWSLLCQAVQTLQDLFLSNDIERGGVIPVVTPQTLEIGSRGRVLMPRTKELGPGDERYLSPEYGAEADEKCRKPDWEKMWVYSLGRTLESSLGSDARTGTLTPVLRFMTAEKPRERASLVSLLSIISERCKMYLPSKPFSHLVMDLYREVFGSPTQCLSSPNSSKRLPVPREESASVTQSTADALQSNSVIVTSSTTKSEKRPPLRNGTDVRRNPVQRAPSRLYRGPGRPRRGDPTPPADCIGPEFVVRSSEPPRKVEMAEDKAHSRRRFVTVVHLTGARIQISCDPQTATVATVFETFVRLERLRDNFIFGLAFLSGGDFVFAPTETKLHKLAPSGWKDEKKPEKRTSAFLLFVRVKFFLPNLRGVADPMTKHLLYLQLRRSVIERQIKCETKDLLTLGGLALQAEFGDHDDREHGGSAYFLLEHYLPEDAVEERSELERQLEDLHISRRGLDPLRAEEIFVAHAQRLPEYGSHHYAARWVRKSVKIPMWVSVNPEGVRLYEKKKNALDRKVHEAFTWRNIQSLKCDDNHFYIVPHDVGKQKLTTYNLRMDNNKSFYLFRLASFHHQFFLKLRVELSSLRALSLEFGIPVAEEDEDEEEKENRKNRTEEWMRRNEGNRHRTPETRPERKGVKMGVRAFGALTRRRLSASTDASNGSSDAYVLDASIKSADETFPYDPQETLPSDLAEKMERVSWAEERVLRKVRLAKDKYGCFGVEVVEGESGGVAVENVLRVETKDGESLRPGDRVIAVNGVCLLNLGYADALSAIRSAGDEIEMVVSHPSEERMRPERKKPVEYEYLKNIRYDTAPEMDNSEPVPPIVGGGHGGFL